MPYTFTKHTFTCEDCGNRCYATQEYLNDMREVHADDLAVTPVSDAVLASNIQVCMRCAGDTSAPMAELVDPCAVRPRTHDEEEN